MRFWFKRNQNSKDTTAPATLKEVDDPVVLHEHNLAKWNYLGYTRCTYVDENNNLKSEHPIFLFVDKNNQKRRSYYIASEYVEKNHPYISKSVKPWAAGEGDIYHIIAGEGNKPSDYLREYMFDHYTSEWDNNTHWWGSSDNAKYNSANSKQKREHKDKETTAENNVVTVDFGKQA